jgi:hypothetical protein
MKTNCVSQYSLLRKFNVGTIAFLLILLAACETKRDDYTEQIAYEKVVKLFAELNVALDASKTVLIIPVDGCSSCIDPTLAFVSEYQESPDIQIILSSHGSKSITMTLAKYYIDKSAVIFDSKGLSEKYGLIRVSPAVVKLSDDKEVWLTRLEGSNTKQVLSNMRLMKN